MTIAAAYLTSEGFVFGADSTTTVSRGAQRDVVQLLNHAQKIYAIGEEKETPFALCTWGAGQIGALSHRTVAALSGDQVKPDSTTMDVAKIVEATVRSEFPRMKGSGPHGYFVGGIDPKTRKPRCIQMLTDPDAQVCKYNELQVGEARFQGAPSYFHRVFHGYDRGLPTALLDALKKRVSDPSDIDKHFAGACQEVLPQFASAGSTDIPIREAIDYVHTYLAVTIKAFKFRYGPPPCGGPIEIGFSTTDRNFRWATHKSFLTAVDESLTHL